MSLEPTIQTDRLPKHIAIIMDGNGRWAQQKGLERNKGHEEGAVAVRRIVEASAKLGIEYLTLYAFSTENWNRPKEEIEALMKLLVHSIHSETPRLMKNNIRLQTIGDVDSLDPDTRAILQGAIDETAQNTRMTLVLALSYSSRWELTDAVRKIAEQIEAGTLKSSDITAETISQNLNTASMPDPDLLIRTSGECRISNFLLWQVAYSEFYFTDIFWPDFDENELNKAIISYQQRERRFGKTSAQVQPTKK